MSKVITNKWGDESKVYLDNLINALQSGDSVKTDSVSSMVERLQSNYISAVFGANPSIVLKQLGSIPMASTYLGGRNFPSLKQIKNIDRTLIGKYTQELDWRTMGYSTPETKFLKDNPGWAQTNKFFDFTFGGGAITAMDGWAASVLWPWAENKVEREHPNLERGSDVQIENGESPFYKEVAKEFNDAVARSQSTSDEIHQSTLRKSKNPFAKMVTMFRSDSAQTYNAIRQKIGEAQYYKRIGMPKEIVKQAKKATGAAVLSMIGGYVFAEAIEFLMNMWKHHGKRYRDDDDELTAMSIAGEMVSGLAGDIAGAVVGGEELYEAIGTIVTGGKWSDINILGIEQLNELGETLTNASTGMATLIEGAVDVLKNEGDVGAYFDRNSGEILGTVKDIASAAITYLPGLPVNNLESYLLGLVKWVSPELGTAYDDLFTKVGKGNLNGMHGEALQARVEDILSDRQLNVSDDAVQALAELYEAEYKGAIPSETPSAISVDGENRQLGAYQKQVYEKAWSEAVGDSLDELVNTHEKFKAASQETQEKMIKKLYSYAADLAKKAVFDDYELDSSTTKIDQMRESGLSLADCVAWNTETSGMKQVEKMKTLRKWDIAEQAKLGVLGTMIGTDMETETGGQTQWAKLQEARKQGVTVDQYLDMRINGTDIDDYIDLMEQGMDNQRAFGFANYLEDMEEDNDDLSDLEKWRASVDYSGTVEYQLAALSVTMQENQFYKVEIAYEFGVEPDDYVRFYEVRDQYDADGNGSFKQSEVRAVIDNEFSELSTKQKAVLWQLMNSSTKNARSNPYSREVGQQVLDAKAAAKERMQNEKNEENEEKETADAGLSGSAQDVLNRLLGKG